ncbi:MAG: hypothetical protein AB7N24_06350 [Dehalococcoidia bacterium]
MKTQLTRLTVMAALSVSAFVSVVPFATSARALSTGDLADWQSNYGATSNSADGDGDVDGRDFLIWQRGGTPTTASNDFLIWQRHYGN